MCILQGLAKILVERDTNILVTCRDSRPVHVQEGTRALLLGYHALTPVVSCSAVESMFLDFQEPVWHRPNIGALC